MLDPLDTSEDAQRLQDAAHAALGPDGRLRVAFEMSESVRQIYLDGLRERFPDASEGELVRRFIVEVHGISLDAGQ